MMLLALSFTLFNLSACLSFAITHHGRGLLLLKFPTFFSLPKEQGMGGLSKKHQDAGT
jgi:hypothetical protein